jgi:signal transduction histidine kinase
MLPIEDAAEHGVSAYRVVVSRLQAADAELELGATDRQILLLSRTGREITELDGRALEQLLPFVDYPILDDLRAAGADPQGDRIEEHALDARRRLLGYLEVATRIATNEFPTSPDEDVEPAPPTIDLSYDQYGRTYLLAYSAIASTGMMVAIQLDQLGLLGSLLDAARPNLRQQLVVVGAKGDVILAGSTTATDPIWFQIPFGTLLPDLRLAIRRGESIARVDALRFLATQLVPLGLAIALGSIALYTRILADRELNDLVARQQAFVARVTHELKTPLAGIRVMAETLLMGVGEDPAKRQDFLDRILGEADRLQVRIDEVLRAAGRTGMSARELLAMDELVQEVLATWKPRLEQAGVELKTSLRPCPLTPIDKALLTDAVSNLIDNALKYRRTDRPSKLWVATRATRSRCLVDVSDNGLGVPAKDRKAIFQPFTRVEQPGRGKAGGHGLGLSFVLEAAKSHGGTVECREGIDGGARFILTIRRQAWKSW